MGLSALVAASVVFWILGYLSRRRFGVLGLALAAGALLSAVWSSQLVGIVERSGISLASISTAGLVSVALVLVPAILLLFSGPSYGKKHGRLVGATLFMILAITLIAEPLSSALVLDSTGRSVFDFIVHHQATIVTAGIILAVLDILAIHTIGGGHRKSKH